MYFGAIYLKSLINEKIKQFFLTIKNIGPDVWQKLTQYYKTVILQLKINKLKNIGPTKFRIYSCIWTGCPTFWINWVLKCMLIFPLLKSVILKGRERGRDTERDSPRNMMLKSNASYLHLLKVTLFIQG